MKNMVNMPGIKTMAKIIKATISFLLDYFFKFKLILITLLFRWLQARFQTRLWARLQAWLQAGIRTRVQAGVQAQLRDILPTDCLQGSDELRRPRLQACRLQVVGLRPSLQKLFQTLN